MRLLFEILAGLAPIIMVFMVVGLLGTVWWISIREVGATYEPAGRLACAIQPSLTYCEVYR